VFFNIQIIQYLISSFDNLTVRKLEHVFRPSDISWDDGQTHQLILPDDQKRVGSIRKLQRQYRNM